MEIGFVCCNAPSRRSARAIACAVVAAVLGGFAVDASSVRGGEPPAPNPPPAATASAAKTDAKAKTAVSARSGPAETTRRAEKPQASGGWIGSGILIDAIHANDLTTAGLAPGDYDYHQTTGYRRAFDYLRARGVRCDRLTDGRLDADRLARGRMLFLNLISGERPPFLVSEIQAIRCFLLNGGSLFVVTDHTNCYYHAHGLKPLFTELGIETYTVTACDKRPRTLDSGNGWIAVTDFRTHPVTAGLKRLGIQTGGCVDPRFAVAWTGPDSWADQWVTTPFGEKNGPGFFGNFQHDFGETLGPLGVVLARPFGKGRIVVVGDQNMLGDAFLNYADNYRLWLNAVAWLLDDKRLADPKPYREWRKPRIVAFDCLEHPEFGDNDLTGSYHALVLLSRHYWTFATDRLDDPCDLLIFANNNDNSLTEPQAAAVVKHLVAGRNAMILNAKAGTLFDPASIVGQLLRAEAARGVARRSEKDRLVLQWPAGGAIYVLGPDTLMDNRSISSPTDAPDNLQSASEKRLLEAVRNALPPTGRP